MKRRTLLGGTITAALLGVTFGLNSAALAQQPPIKIATDAANAQRLLAAGSPDAVAAGRAISVDGRGQAGHSAGSWSLK